MPSGVISDSHSSFTGFADCAAALHANSRKHTPAIFVILSTLLTSLSSFLIAGSPGLTRLEQNYLWAGSFALRWSASRTVAATPPACQQIAGQQLERT